MIQIALQLRGNILRLLFVVGVLMTVFIMFGQKAEAAQPPSWVQTYLQNYCTDNPTGGRTIGYMYPSPSTITGTSSTQTFQLKATIHVCADQTYFPLDGGGILIQNPLPSGVTNLSGGNNFNLGAVPIGGFAEEVSKSITATLSPGSNQFCFTYRLRADYTNGSSSTSTGTGVQCITVIFNQINFTINPEVILPQTTAAPGETVRPIYHRACTSSGDSVASGIQLTVPSSNDFYSFSISEEKNLSANGGCHTYTQNFFTVPANAQNGDRFCGTISASPRAHNNNGTVTSTERCLTVVVPINYTLRPDVSIPKTTLVHGETVTVGYEVCTSSGDTAAAGISIDPGQNIWNPAAFNANIPANGGCWSTTRNVTVPAGTAPGTQYCAQVSASPRSSSNNSSVSSANRCMRVVASYNHSLPAIPAQGDLTSGSSGIVSTCIGNSGTWPSPSGTVYRLRDDQTNVVTQIGSGSVPASGSCSRNIDVGYTIGNGDIGDDYCFTIQVVADNGQFTSPGSFTSNGVTQRSFCVTLVEQPYLTVEGGSVWAGGNFDASPFGIGSSNCFVPGGASEGFIQTVTRSIAGAFATYGGGATSDIRGFSSLAAASPINSNLFLANTTATPGNFDTLGMCIPDLYSYASQDTTSDLISPLGSPSLQPGERDGQYFRFGSLSIDQPVELTQGQRLTIIVDGDVTISEDITYSYSGSSLDDIPVFILIVNGDITIANNVTQLSGLYVARGASGQISTCEVAGQLNSTLCTNQLNVSGIFAANEIQYRRTYGGVSGQNANGGVAAAERFTSAAELYLASPTIITEYRGFLRTAALRDLPPAIN